MLFYVVEFVVEKGREEIAKRFMCDCRECPNFKTREKGMSMEKAIIGFTVRSMKRYDACSSKCQDAIRKMEDAICE